MAEDDEGPVGAGRIRIPRSRDDRINRFSSDVVSGLDSFTPERGQDPRQMEKSAEELVRGTLERHGLKLREVPEDVRDGLNQYVVDRVAGQFPDAAAGTQAAASITKGLNLRHRKGPFRVAPIERPAGEGAGGGQRVIRVGGGQSVVVQPAQRTPEQVRGLRRKEFERIGVKSHKLQEELLKEGINPFEPGNRTIDAAKHNLRLGTVGKLVDHGFKVTNIPGIESERAGFTQQELVRGRSLGSGTAAGQARLERSRGLFRRKVVFEDDGAGGVRRVTLDPRFTGGGVVRGLKGATVGALRKGAVSRREAREARRLAKSPLRRIEKIERVARNQMLAQIQGELPEATGLRRVYLRAKLSTLKWGLIHKGWAMFLLSAAVVFVPWLGLVTWTGWGLAALALTLLKFGAFVLVNVYNVIASALVSIVNVVGNFVSGGLEALSVKWLTQVGIDPVACGEEACERVFSYTVSSVDTTFPGIPDLPEPTSFDSRTLLDLLLGLFGIKFDLFNDIRRFLRGE